MKCLSYRHRMKCSSRLRKLLCRYFIWGMTQLYSADGVDTVTYGMSLTSGA
jgi:hypothetical protein